MSAKSGATSIPGIPLDDDGPVFREPWEAQAFAMTLALHERVGAVGSTVQFRGGFGLAELGGSRVLATLVVAALGYGAGYAHLGWSLRTRL